jgi:hypothetical protein
VKRRNYSSQKRQRELAKQKQREDKRARKRQRNSESSTELPPAEQPQQATVPAIDQEG